MGSEVLGKAYATLYLVRDTASARRSKGSMESTLMLLDAQVSLWECSVEKIVAQLSSIMNLLEQQEVLKRSKLGVLSQHPGHVISLLDLKLMESMERALEFITKERCVYVCVHFFPPPNPTKSPLVPF